MASNKRNLDIETPTLDALMAAGVVRIDAASMEYVGTAADGITVSFGSVGQERALDRYLTTHSTPATW